MRAFTRRRFWIALRYRLGVLGVGLAYLLAALEIPLPVFVHKESSQPFPCQNHPCGCRTAEECWSHCCCYTPEERWAWAKAHNVEPPAYAEKPSEKPVARGWNRVKLRDRDQEATTANCCCQAKAEQASCCKPATDRSTKASSTNPRSRGVTTFSALRCQGYSTLWINAGSVLPVLPLAAWSPDRPPSTRIDLFSIKADQIPSSPLDPPPRLSLV
jgi:hypothetical protein